MEKGFDLNLGTFHRLAFKLRIRAYGFDRMGVILADSGPLSVTSFKTFPVHFLSSTLLLSNESKNLSTIPHSDIPYKLW